MKPIIGILGPTAVGKTKLSLQLASDLNTEIISADSMQIYKEFDIGTAKASVEERKQIRHHLIDIVEPHENFSSYLFKKETQNVLNDFEKRGLIPLIVGGTGFFLKNLLYQFDFEEGSNLDNIRASLKQKQSEFGEDYLFELLKEIDPASSQIIHPNDTKKITRALEIFYSTGQKKSEGKNLQEPLYEYILFVLNKDRQKIYDNINKRVDQMIEEGLIEEVEKLYKKLPAESQSLKGIGYKELIPYFKGEYSLEQAMELIKQHSRNYAKRQITFFKKIDVIWLDAELPTNELIKTIKQSYFEKFGIEI